MTVTKEYDPRLKDLGVSVYTPASDLSPGDLYWEAVKIDFWGEAKSQGKHHVYVRTLDMDGKPMDQVKVRWFWPDGEDIKKTSINDNNPSNMLNFGMYAAGHAYSIQVTSPNFISVIVDGLGLGDVERRHHNIHVCYLITFQLVKYMSNEQPQLPDSGDPEDPEPEEPEEPEDDSKLTTRELNEINLATYYSDNLAHGTAGHNRLMLIAKLARMLEL